MPWESCSEARAAAGQPAIPGFPFALLDLFALHVHNTFVFWTTKLTGAGALLFEGSDVRKPCQEISCLTYPVQILS